MKNKLKIRFSAMVTVIAVVLMSFSIQGFAEAGDGIPAFNESLNEQNGEGNEKVYEAETGGVYFERLEDAVASAQEGGIVTIVNDFTIDDAFVRVQNKTLTIDLNKHTILVDNEAMYAFLEREGDLTIKNGTINSTGENNNWGCIATLGGKLTVEDVVLSNKRAYGYCVKLQETSDIGSVETIANFKNVTINSTMGGGVESSLGVKSTFENCTMTQTGYYDWNSTNIAVCNGAVATIKNGSYTSDSGYAAYVFNSGGTINIEGGTFTGEKAAIRADKSERENVSTIVVSGGIFNGNVQKADGAFLKITGGKFDDDVSEYLDENYAQDENGNIIEDTSKAVQIEDKYYPTLADAVKEVGSGEIITLKQNLIGSGIKVKSGSDFIIDLGGHTYTVVDPLVGSQGTETNGFQLLAGSDITFRNGTIKAGSENVKILIQNYSNLTLDGVTLEGTTCDYVVSNNNGASRITGNTNIIAGEGKVAFDVYYWPSNGYGNVSMTIDKNMTGKITGKIEYADDGWADDSVVAENAIISIAGGTFSEPVNPDFCAPGFAPTKNADGEYTVGEITASAVLTDGGASAVVEGGEGTLRFVTNVDELSGTPTSYGTYMVPVDIFDNTELKDCVTVQYQYADDKKITAGQSFAADLTNIPGQYLNVPIYAMSFMYLDGVEAPVTVELPNASVNSAMAQ